MPLASPSPLHLPSPVASAGAKVGFSPMPWSLPEGGIGPHSEFRPPLSAHFALAEVAIAPRGPSGTREPTAAKEEAPIALHTSPAAKDCEGLKDGDARDEENDAPQAAAAVAGGAQFGYKKRSREEGAAEELGQGPGIWLIGNPALPAEHHTAHLWRRARLSAQQLAPASE